MKWTKAEVMCYRKRRYASEIQASCAIGKMRVYYPDAALVDWKWYQCPICRGYHITKQSQDNPEYQKRRWMAGLDNSPKYATVTV
jgi:hypothetical protein